eukprot:352266-Chlamydomonas_euryale.AAC.3
MAPQALRDHPTRTNPNQIKPNQSGLGASASGSGLPCGDDGHGPATERALARRELSQSRTERSKSSPAVTCATLVGLGRAQRDAWPRPHNPGPNTTQTEPMQTKSRHNKTQT